MGSEFLWRKDASQAEWRRRPVHLLPDDFQFFHQLIKRRAADPEFRGSGTDSARMGLQSLLNHFSFQTLASFLEGDRGQRVSGIGQFHVGNSNSFAFRHDDRPLDAILEFAHVTRPLMSVDRPQGFRRESQTRPAILHREPLEKLLRHETNILPALPQRREADHHDRQPKV